MVFVAYGFFLVCLKYFPILGEMTSIYVQLNFWLFFLYKKIWNIHIVYH